MKYVNGVFKYDIFPDESILCLTISADKGQQLETVVETIIKTYKGTLTTVLFKNTSINQTDLVPICKEMHESKIKTAVHIDVDDVSAINKRLFDLLDYVLLSNGKILKKDYCPFADGYDWVEI